MSFELSNVLSFLFLDSLNLVISSKSVDNTFSTSCFDDSFLIFQLILDNVVLNFNFQSYVKITEIFQDSIGLKFLISLSFSTINLTATDCTLPADNHFLIFFHKTGLTLYQTSLSSNLLAC